MTPAKVADDLPALLDAALAGGDVASLVITGRHDALAARAEALTPIAQAKGLAVLIHNDIAIADRFNADGIHTDTGLPDLNRAKAAAPSDKIVGAGGIGSRHEAMLVGEAEPDYLLFGRLDQEPEATIHPKTLELASWWAGLFVIPAIVMGGAAIESVDEAVAAGIDFVALAETVWDHPDGPGAAVAETNQRLAFRGARAA